MDTKKYWENQTSSMNRANDESYYELKHAEHLLIMKDADFSGGLVDYGYGDGLLLQKYSQNIKCEITGVDFSKSLYKVATKLKYSSPTNLYLGDAIEYTVNALGSTWTSCGAINQFSNQDEMNLFLTRFIQNKFVRELYLFDCIDPIRYWLYSYGVVDSYIYHKNKKITPGKIIGHIKACNLLIANLLKNKMCIPVSEMGYGFNPNYWLEIANSLRCNVRIVSSQMYEYRYHVILKKT